MKHYGVTVMELNGSGDEPLIEEAQIIVTTPEKWDIITTRKSGYKKLASVKLLIIDEIHLLHDDNIGPVLESIVARTVRQIETTNEHIRLVGLSAKLLNNDDLALFMRVDMKKGLFRFDNSYRACPLAQQYAGITVEKPFQLMNDICYEKVMEAVAGNKHHQVLIFVHSRDETRNTASGIIDSALANDTHGIFLKEDSESREILHQHTEVVKSNDLKDLLPYRVAIHHAEMCTPDLQLVEKLFADGHIKVLVSIVGSDSSINSQTHSIESLEMEE